MFRSRRQSSITASPPPLAHVHLSPVLNLSPSFLTNVSKSCVYDDTHKQLLVIADNKVLYWNLPEISRSHGAHAESGSNPNSPRTTEVAGVDSVVSPQVCFLSQGPVVTARFSPDMKILAIQRSATEIEFVNQQDGSQFWQKCKGGSKLGLGPETKLLGFFWCSEMNKFDIVFVTTAGLELYKLLDSRKGMQMKEVKKHPIKWYKYTADTKLVLIATGEDCTRLFGYQFAPQGLIKLPRFDLDMQSGQAGPGGVGKPRLTSDAVHPVALYGKLFCCHINQQAERVVLYRLYKDAIIKQFSFPTYSSNMGISIVDNLLLVHHMNTGLVMIFDIMTNNMQPFVSPLPSLCREPSVSPNHSARMQIPGSQPYQAGAHGQTQLSLSPSTGSKSMLSVMAKNERRAEEEAEAEETGPNPFKRGNQVVCVTMSNFLLAMDAGNEMVWKIELDLNAIAISCPNRLHTISFLHRRSEAKHPRRSPKEMIIGTVKSMVQEHEAISVLKQAFEIICFVISSSPGARPRPAPAPSKPPNQSPANLAAIATSGSLDFHQLYEQIFEPLYDDQGVEPAFLFCALETFYLCSASFQLKLPSCYFCLMVDILVAMSKFEVLSQYLAGHFFEDSKGLARKLEELSGDYPHLSQCAVDMYFRLKEYDECCAILFKHGRLIDALRFLKDYHLSSITPVTFLDAAAKKRDPMVFASVYRFCKEFVPDLDIDFSVKSKYASFFSEEL